MKKKLLDFAHLKKKKFSWIFFFSLGSTHEKNNCFMKRKFEKKTSFSCVKVIYFLLLNAYFWHRKQVVLSCIGKNYFPKEKKSTSSCKKNFFSHKKNLFHEKKDSYECSFHSITRKNLKEITLSHMKKKIHNWKWKIKKIKNPRSLGILFHYSTHEKNPKKSKAKHFFFFICKTNFYSHLHSVSLQSPRHDMAKNNNNNNNCGHNTAITCTWNTKLLPWKKMRM